MGYSCCMLDQPFYEVYKTLTPAEQRQLISGPLFRSAPFCDLQDEFHIYISEHLGDEDCEHLCSFDSLDSALNFIKEKVNAGSKAVFSVVPDYIYVASEERLKALNQLSVLDVFRQYAGEGLKSLIRSGDRRHLADSDIALLSKLGLVTYENLKREVLEKVLAVHPSLKVP